MSTTNWNASIQFPTDNCFANRVVSAKFAPNNNGNPMITLELEVLTPETYEVDGQLISIAGVKAKHMAVVKNTDSEMSEEELAESNAKCNARVFEGTPDKPALFELFGIDGKTVDKNNPDVKQLEGKIVLTAMSARKEEKRKTPTSAQIAAAKEKGVKPEGDVMKHPITGKKLCNWWPQIDDIYGLAPDQTIGNNKPY
jgi:hypothetical protein